MTGPAPSVSTSRARWRDNLIDLTRRNPLLSLRPTQSTFLTISLPAVQAVFDRLVQANKPWTFWLPPVDQEEDDHAQAPDPPPPPLLNLHQPHPLAHPLPFAPPPPHPP